MRSPCSMRSRLPSSERGPVTVLGRWSASRFAAMDTLRTTTPRTCLRSCESRSPAAIQSSVSRRNSARKPTESVVRSWKRSVLRWPRPKHPLRRIPPRSNTASTPTRSDSDRQQVADALGGRDLVVDDAGRVRMTDVGEVIRTLALLTEKHAHAVVEVGGRLRPHHGIHLVVMADDANEWKLGFRTELGAQRTADTQQL